VSLRRDDNTHVNGQTVSQHGAFPSLRAVSRSDKARSVREFPEIGKKEEGKIKGRNKTGETKRRNKKGKQKSETKGESG
jgi:hypothetical protein